MQTMGLHRLREIVPPLVIAVSKRPLNSDA